ncbi:LPS-assembly protein [Methylovirgula ligni]|uniref:LPS-assembly protein LptD n=2 Tax=Methylovirgula ligni TaxID=569860 RepID=A0A3D9YRQ7_9HYPH|nr:LPS-assembly protein [Methylovirgula ligni]
MGRRICPTDFGPGRSPLRPALRMRGVVLALCALFLFGFVPARPALAQTSGGATQAATQPDKMFVEADQLVYDRDKNTVSAVGNARIYYQGRTLQADRVIYNRNTGRVFAEGHAKLINKDGNIVYGDSFDMTKDFREGFVESLRSTSTEKTYFSAPHAEITQGAISVYDKGTYTACATCADNPTKPPLWRVRAKRIVHNNDEHMIYYTDAWLEFLGVPVAYVPVFSSPDPTVKRKSGILSPQTISSSILGFGVQVPVFWAIAPNYDLTWTPTYFVNEGFYNDFEWRHRLASGSYFIRANGIFQTNPNLFPESPWGAAGHSFRGSLETRGEFLIDKYWKYGWNITALSDKWYFWDYAFANQSSASQYYTETVSDAYLTGQGNDSYFDLRGFHFEGLTSRDIQQTQPNALVLDYNHLFGLDPKKTAGIGGEVVADFNLTSVSQQIASYSPVAGEGFDPATQLFDPAVGLYEACTLNNMPHYVPGTKAGDCLLRGIGGTQTRTTADLSWQRKFVDPIGEVWTPFVFARLNGEWLDLNTNDNYEVSNPGNGANYTYFNSDQTNFVGQVSGVQGYVMPGAGLEYRYPIFVNTSFGSAVVEPIGQIIVRPNNLVGSNSLVNMDSQSLVFDETNLFAWNKYSGYDQFETGTRANYGGQATFNLKNGGYVNFIAGQSYQVAGTNGFDQPSAVNNGLASGLETRASDYVGALTVAPLPFMDFTAKGLFNTQTFQPDRLDIASDFNLGAWTGGVDFANYAVQPVLGYYVPREGLSLNSRYQITPHYFVQGNITFDMSRQYYPPSLTGNNNVGPWAVASEGIGAGYHDECTSLLVNYSSVYQDIGTGTIVHNQTFLVQLQLRSLGDARYSQTSYANGAQSLDR